MHRRRSIATCFGRDKRRDCKGYGGENNMSDWRDDNEIDLPAWPKILDPRQRPIDTNKLNKDELIAEFDKRFVALLQMSDSTNSLEGWRDVAVDLPWNSILRSKSKS